MKPAQLDMFTPHRTADRTHVAVLLQELCVQHRLPFPRLEWSSRMVSTLGKAYPSQNLIRMSTWLSAEQADNTIRHELAHLAAGHAALRQPHGMIWKVWAMRFGAAPRACSPIPPALRPQHLQRRLSPAWGLECPGCGVRLMRHRLLPGLYHRNCGPRQGMLVRVLKARSDVVRQWVAEGVRRR